MRARIAACGKASEIAGRVRDFRPCKGSSQPGKPPAENQRRLIAKIKTITIANQKLGIATPSCVAPITVTSLAPPRRLAAKIPAGNAIKVDRISA